MSTNFPNNLDSFQNPSATDDVASVDHAAQHSNANDAIEALQAKVGIDGSAVQSSHDFKLSDVEDGDRAASKAELEDHLADTENPHEVTKSQVGLGNVDNTSDATKNSAMAIFENKTIDADDNLIENLKVNNFKSSAITTESDTIDANDNDETIPTSAAVKAYVDANAGGGNVVTFPSSGTYTVPVSAKMILVEVLAAGGSGGATNYNDSGSGIATGGGGGEFRSALFFAQYLGASVAVTVGAGGVAKTTSGRQAVAGAAGGDSSFGTYIVAKGGGGGIAELVSGTGDTGVENGGTGGSGGSTTGMLAITNANGAAGGTARANGGGGGGNTVTNGANSTLGGAGGGSAAVNAPFGFIMAASNGGTATGGFGGNGGDGSNTAGEDASDGGGGGGGAASSSNITSGKGGDGWVRVTEFF